MKISEPFISTPQFLSGGGETANENRYRGLIQGLPVAMYTCDAQGHITLYNEAAVELWGRTPELGKDKWSSAWKMYKTDGSVLNPEHCPMAIALKEGRIVKMEILVERPDGIRRHVMPHPQPVYDDERKIIGAVNMLIDITDQKQSQRNLEENEIRLRLATEGAKLATWDLDLKSRNIIYSNRLAEIFGHDKRKILTHFKMRDQIHHDDIAIVEKAFKKAMQTGIYDYDARVVKPDQSVCWIRTQGKVLFSEDNIPMRLLGTLMDITDQKAQSEMLEIKVEERTKELVKQKEFVDAILDSTVDIIAVFDMELRYLSLNRKACEIYGKEEKEVIGKNILDVFPVVKTTGMYEGLSLALKGKTTHDPKYRSPILKRHFENFYIPLKHGNGEVYGALLIGHENTAIVEAAEKLKITNQVLEEKNIALERSNKELESFSYVASHDLQEPLRKIQTFADLLKNNRHNEEMAERYLDKIKSSSQRMSDLIKSVLNYSRLAKTQDKSVLVNLNTIVDDIKTDFELLLSEKNAVIRHGKLPSITGIPLQLNQLFSNLISNSIKFSDKDPVIDITSREVPAEEMKSHPFLKGGKKYIELKFTDNGIGFEQQYAEKIFTIFQRLHDKLTYVGTGIGLALCKKIVENHSGYIRAESELGKGAVFLLYFPKPGN